MILNIGQSFNHMKLHCSSLPDRRSINIEKTIELQIFWTESRFCTGSDTLINIVSKKGTMLLSLTQSPKRYHQLHIPI